ncbi:MAG: pyridoxamine 5'-phosphate oxidase family protein [Deltaproteobacteria bacterium]
MDLKAYFDAAQGHGVLATADASGRVNVAIFARPHVMDDGAVAFIMPQRLTHKNLQANPQAAYLFLESGPGYQGLRLTLTKIREEQDTELLYALRRRSYPAAQEKQEGSRFLVFFKVEKILPVIGAAPKEEKI